MEENKFMTQLKMIKDLWLEKKSLKKRVRELEKMVADNQAIIKAAETYRNEYAEAQKALIDAKEKYTRAYKDMLAEKSKYQAEVEEFIGTLKGRK